MGKHHVLEIFGKKHSSAGAGFQMHSWASAGKREISSIVGFEGTPAITSHNNEGTSLTGKRIVLRLPAETSQA